MNTIKAWGLSIAVLAGTGVPAWCAPPTESPESRSWISRLWSKPEAKPAPPRPIATAPLPPEALAEAVEAEARAYMRRMDVCTELRRVALEKNDELLLRQVEELESQASNLYNQRTAALGVKKGLPAMPAVLDAQSTPMESRTSLTRGVTR